MRIRYAHRWNLGYSDAVALQDDLRRRVRLDRLALRALRFVAGADVAVSKRTNRLFAAVVVFRFPDLEPVETRFASVGAAFPYIPGLLSFREIPVLVACLKKIRHPVDVILCDGQGIAHPRGFGLASHLGVLLDTPTIGCAKSRLVGEHGEVGPMRGDAAPLYFEGKRVGTVLRTREGVKPLFISPGHRVDHASSRRVVLATGGGFRLPEPTRAADRLAGEEKRRWEARAVSP